MKPKDTIHPITRLIALFDKPKTIQPPVRRLIKDELCWAPFNVAEHARGKDQNPIHQSQMHNLPGSKSRSFTDDGRENA